MIKFNLFLNYAVIFNEHLIISYEYMNTIFLKMAWSKTSSQDILSFSSIYRHLIIKSFDSLETIKYHNTLYLGRKLNFNSINII